MELTALGLGTIIGAALTGVVNLYRDGRDKSRVDKATRRQVLAHIEALDGAFSVLYIGPAITDELDADSVVERFIRKCDEPNVALALDDAQREVTFDLLNTVIKARSYFKWCDAKLKEDTTAEEDEGYRAYISFWALNSAIECRNALKAFHCDGDLNKYASEHSLRPLDPNNLKTLRERAAACLSGTSGSAELEQAAEKATKESGPA